MAKKSAVSQVLAVSGHWQLAFITATILGWLSQAAATAFMFATNGFVGLGTWVFQITWWALPFAYFLVAFGLLREYRLWVHRLFVASISATIGMTAYTIATTWFNDLRYHYWPPAAPSPNDRSWWTAFGQDWLLMLGGLAVYTVLVGILVRRAKR